MRNYQYNYFILTHISLLTFLVSFDLSVSQLDATKTKLETILWITNSLLSSSFVFKSMFPIGFRSCHTATLEHALDSINDIMSDIDNFHLRNRQWLEYVFDVFYMEKELSNFTFRSFEEWIQARTKVEKKSAYSL